VPFDPPSSLPLAALSAGHPCYEPRKDIVMPSFKDLATFLPDHLPPRTRRRSRLFYFAGDLVSPEGSVDAGPHTNASYSLGIRQAVFRAVRSSGLRGLEMSGRLKGDYYGTAYSANLRDALFCGAFPGDGWSGGISAAIMAGCIPLIIGDGLEMPFENVLNYSAFSLRVAEADIPRLPAILAAVPRDAIEVLLDGVRRVRPRFTYSSIASNELRVSANRSHVAPLLEPLAAEAKKHEDALATVVRILRYRLRHRAPRVHREGRSDETS